MLLDAQNVGGFPPKVLAAIHADHLPRDRRGIQKKPKRRSDIVRVCAALQDRVLALFLEMFSRLPTALQGRPRPDPIHPHARCQPLRGGLGKGPQPHFSQRVGHEFGRQFVDALI